jgi:hypothetical protein
MCVCLLVVAQITAQDSAKGQQFTQSENVAEQPVNTELLFARLKKLVGRWQARSTKGWTGGDLVRLISRGSVVIFESEFDDDADAGRGMATLCYLDKGRLLLTHYCEAKNQPTLVATGQSPDGKTVLFTFLSGTGMTSREQGHMDKVLFTFVDDDSYRSQWTWYSAGTEKWLEEIEYHRVSADSKSKSKQ